MQVKSFTKNSNFTAIVDINGMDVTIDYTSQGNISPQTMNVRAHFVDGGVSSAVNRTYNLRDRNYSPVGKVVIYPFDTAFNDEMLSIVDKINANHSDPFETIEAVEL